MHNFSNLTQTVDSKGVPIPGLYKNSDGSLVVLNNREYMKTKAAFNAIDKLNSEVEMLKTQMTQILNKLGSK
jgi:hypothetical protein